MKTPLQGTVMEIRHISPTRDAVLRASRNQLIEGLFRIGYTGRKNIKSGEMRQILIDHFRLQEGQ